MRALGVTLVLSLLFSGDLVRLHGHADGAPASADCAACVAGLANAVGGGPPASFDPPGPTVPDPDAPATAASPCLVFVRHGGLRDPPSSRA